MTGLSILHIALYFYGLRSTTALKQKVHYLHFTFELGASESLPVLLKSHSSYMADRNMNAELPKFEGSLKPNFPKGMRFREEVKHGAYLEKRRF